MSTTPNSSTLLTTCQAARRLGLAAGTLGNKRAAGQGPAWVKYGRSVRYRPEDLDAFVSAHRVVPDGQEGIVLQEIKAGLKRISREMHPYGSFENTPEELQQRFAVLCWRWSEEMARREGLPQ